MYVAFDFNISKGHTVVPDKAMVVRKLRSIVGIQAESNCVIAGISGPCEPPINIRMTIRPIDPTGCIEHMHTY